MSVTFLTGASSGIGRSLALRLALQRETIAVVARRQALLDTLVEEIVRVGGRALAIQCDVTDRARVFAAAEEAQAALGPIDRLIANAGGGEPTFVETFDAAQIQRVFAVNVGGTANCIEAVLPAMLQRGMGHIVAVSSLAAYRGLPSAAAYSGAKAALSNMIESLRIDRSHEVLLLRLFVPVLFVLICQQKRNESRSNWRLKKRAPDGSRNCRAETLLRLSISSRPCRRLGAHVARVSLRLDAFDWARASAQDWQIAGKEGKFLP